jgi:hypothetical protein
MVTAAAGVWAALGLSKYAAWLAVAGAGGLIIGAFSPVSDWLTAPLEHRFAQWDAGSQVPTVDGIIVLDGEAGARVAALAELSRLFPQARLVYSGPGGPTEAILNKFAGMGGDRERRAPHALSHQRVRPLIVILELPNWRTGSCSQAAGQ